MPSTTYMQIDDRRDHSFRIPRPELTRTRGAPNACNRCHEDQTPEWAQGVLEAAGRADSQDWFQRLADTGPEAAGALETALGLAVDDAVPPLLRATAINRVNLAGDERAYQALGDMLNNSDALIRLGAVRALRGVEPRIQAALGARRLRDPSRAVRMELLPILAALGPEALDPADRRVLEAVQEEYLDSQMALSGWPQSWVNQGNLYVALGRIEEAESAYRQAMEIGPDFVPGYANLADLYRATSRESEGETVLREGLARQPGQIDLTHSLGLNLVRQGHL